MPAGEVPDDPRSYLPGGDPHGVNRAGVLAYFSDRGRAKEAAAALRAAGLGPVSVEDVHPQAVDREDLRQESYPRLGLENNIAADLPLDPRTQASTLVALAATGQQADRARALLRRYGAEEV